MEQLSGRLADAGREAVALGLELGRDNSGYHWKRRSVPVASLGAGMAAYDELLGEIEEAVALCTRSGLLAALADQTPTTPETTEPVDEAEEQTGATG